MTKSDSGILNTYSYAVSVKDVYTNGYTIPKGKEVVAFRPPLGGEMILCESGTDVYTTSQSWGLSSPRLILRDKPIPTIKDIYKTDYPVIPAGWVSTGEIKDVTTMEGKFLSMYSGTCIDGKDFRRDREPQWRLLLKPAPPPRKTFTVVLEECPETKAYAWDSLEVNDEYYIGPTVARVISITPAS